MSMAPLLRHAVAADRGFERMYRRHATDVYRYALAVLQNEADAEDVTQTTFLNAYRAIERGERPQMPHNWLIAIAHNVCRQRFRQLSRRPSEVGWDDDVADRMVEDDEAPSGQDIRRALAHLAFNQRAALVMRELEGRSYAEIAELLGVSVSAVETLIFRARRALREQLEGSLTCSEAERSISKQLDGRLDRTEKSSLRAHLRECADCAALARRQRAQRSALRGVGLVPLPASLSSLLGGGATTGAAVAAKAAAVLVVATGVGGAAYEGATHVQTGSHARPTPTHASVVSAPRRTAILSPTRAAAPPVHAATGIAVHVALHRHGGSRIAHAHRQRHIPSHAVLAPAVGSAASAAASAAPQVPPGRVTNHGNDHQPAPAIGALVQNNRSTHAASANGHSATAHLKTAGSAHGRGNVASSVHKTGPPDHANAKVTPADPPSQDPVAATAATPAPASGTVVDHGNGNGNAHGGSGSGGHGNPHG